MMFAHIHSTKEKLYGLFNLHVQLDFTIGAYLLYHLHLLKIFVIRAYTNVTSKLTTLDEISVIINFAKETSIKLINNIPNIIVQQIIKQRIYFFIILPICSIVFTSQQVQTHKRT